MVREIRGSGYVVAPHSTTAFSRYEGKITGMTVEVGDHFKAGEILVVMEDASVRLALGQTKAARASADMFLRFERSFWRKLMTHFGGPKL